VNLDVKTKINQEGSRSVPKALKLIITSIKSKSSEPEPLSLNDKWNRIGEPVWKEATNTIGYTRKQAGKEWCEKLNEDAIHRVTRAAKDKYRKARSIKRNLFKETSRQLNEEAIE
jgi:hypothetical protein